MAVDAGTIYSEVRIAVEKLSGDIKRIEAKLDQFGKKNKQESQKVQASWKQSFAAISIAGVAAFTAIGLAVKQAIETFSNYQQSMANVRSVTSASAEDFAKLEEAAIQAGESTRFTASQAADALYFLASAGLDATQSVDALNGVLQLAGATGSDLASTSASMAATLAQFNLDAEESTRVSNVFAAAISNSQATMEKLSSALKQVGPISGALGISLEETTAGLEALFNAGFAGEQAGTGLRNILLDLSDASGPVVQQLEQLGVAFEDVNPKQVGLTNAIDELAKSGIDLGTVFGKRVAAQILTLAQVGGDALEELQDEITDTNAAAEMYEVQNDTLAGSVDFLNSALESASIKLVETLEPAFRGIVDTLTAAVKAFSSLPAPVKTFVGAVGILIPALGGLGVAIAGLNKVLTAPGVGGFIGAFSIAVTTLSAFATLIMSVNSAMEAHERRYIDAANAVQEQRTELNDLLGEYDRLQEESENSEEAQDELKNTINELAGILPDAAVEFDEYGQAIGIAREEAAQFSSELLQNNIDLLESELALQEASIISLDQRIGKMQEFINQKREEIQLKQELLGTTESLLEQAQIQADIDWMQNEINSIQQGTGLMEGIVALMDERIDRASQIEEIEKRLYDLRIQADPELRAAEEERLRLLEEQKQAQEEAAEAERLAQEEAERRAEEQLRLEEEYAKLREEFRREGLTDMERELEDLDKRRREFAEAGIDTEEWYQQRLQEIREKYADTGDEGEAEGGIPDDVFEDQREIIDMRDEYIRKLEQLGATQLEIIELQRQEAIASIEASDASATAKENAINAVNEYYDTLRDDTANQEFMNNFMSMSETMLSGWQGILGSLQSLFSALTQRRIEELERQMQEELRVAGLLEESETERLQRSLDEAIEAGDMETAEKLEDDLERARIEEEFQKKIAMEKYRGELQAWRYNLMIGYASAASAILSGYATKPFLPVGLAAGILASVKSAIQIAAIKAQKPNPPSFQTGGIVIPSGQGGTEVEVAENGSPELLLNSGAEGRAFLNQFGDLVASRVNAAGGQFTINLDIDGKRVAETTANYYNNGIVRVKL